jgi:anti-anti-sigma factor
MRITHTTDPPGFVVDGDVDVWDLAELERALVVAVRQPGDEVYLDLFDLDFMNLDGVRLLVAAAADLHARGRVLVLFRLAVHLRRMIEVVGWDSAPGLVLWHDVTALPEQGRSR